MRTLLVALACLFNHAHTRIEQEVVDNREKYIAMLLTSLNPSRSLATRGFRTRGLRMQVREVGLGERSRVGQQIGEIDGSLREDASIGSVASVRNEIVSVRVEGGTLKTWSFASPSVDRVQVSLSSEGRPFDADIELWQGPDNTPVKMRVHSEDGRSRPFNAVIETPKAPNTVAIRNIAEIAFPLAASVIANEVEEPISNFPATAVPVQGGALRTFPFGPEVQRVEVMLKSDGRPLNARIELLQGPNNNRQVIELYADDGLQRPFFAIIDTVGSGTVVRVVNTAPLEFPMVASVMPHYVDDELLPLDPVIDAGMDTQVGIGGPGARW